MSDNEEKIPVILTKLLKSEEITIYEYTYLIFLLKNFNMIGLNYLTKILNRVDNEKLRKIYVDLDKNKILVCNSEGNYEIDNNSIFSNFKKSIILKLNDDQKESCKKIINFILSKNKNTFGLFGYAGTGKTTILVELLAHLIKNKYIKSVVFTAPTNKALNVIKSKIRHYLIDINNALSNSKIFNKNKDFEELVTILNTIGVKIEFMTIHGLLKFESDLSDNGDLIFVRNTGKNLISKFDIVIVDECSMIPIKMIDVIISEITSMNSKNNAYIQVPKIIFAGDPAQLPPIFEDKSAIFIKNADELPINEYISFLEADTNDEKYYGKSITIKKYENDVKQKHFVKHKNLVEHILKMDKVTMKEVMRNRIDAVVELCYETRLLALGKVEKVKYDKCIGKDGVNFYDVSQTPNKIESEWFKKFMKKISKNKPSIIITWTNPQANAYNHSARKMIFKDKTNINKFEKGDILILANTYDIEPKNDENSSTRLHTSEQIKVLGTSLTTKFIETFDEKIDKNSLNMLVNSEQYSKQYQITTKNINEKIKKSVRAWKLDICRLDNDKEIFEIWILDEAYENQLKYDKEYSLNGIKLLKRKLCSKFPKKEKQIIKHIINPIKKEWYSKFVKPFASVSYGYSITCHKSQGSDFSNVFVDVDDIAKNRKLQEMKQCLYTAVTRVSQNIYLLL